MDHKNYTLSEASAEEQKAFQIGLEELLTTLSLSIALVINKKGVTLKNEEGKEDHVFVDSPVILLQKKTLVEVVSPLSDELTGSTIDPVNPQPQA